MPSLFTRFSKFMVSQISYPRVWFLPFVEASEGLSAAFAGLSVWLTDCCIIPGQTASLPNMPQEVSVSYQAVKSKVYRLIDALVAGEKSQADVQESIRRWWGLIHPADRPIAQKYLQTVLGRSVSALDAIGDGLTSSNGCVTTYGPLPSERMKVMERMIKEAGVHSTV